MRGRGVRAVESGPGYGHVGAWVAYEAALEDVRGLRFRSRGAEDSAEHGGGVTYATAETRVPVRVPACGPARDGSLGAAVSGLVSSDCGFREVSGG